MSFLEKLWNSLSGNTDASPGGDPERQLAAFVRDLNAQLETLHRAVAAALADEKRIKMQIEEHVVRASEWESRAVLALRGGDETLAREALLRKEDSERSALALQRSWDAQRQATEKLKASLRAGKAQAEEARTKYTLLLAQYRSAAASRSIQKLASGSSEHSPMRHIEQLTERIHRIEAETEANLELAGAGVGAVDLEATFQELERRTRGDAALAALKDRLSTQRQLTGPAAPGDPLAALRAKLDQR